MAFGAQNNFTGDSAKKKGFPLMKHPFKILIFSQTQAFFQHILSFYKIREHFLAATPDTQKSLGGTLKKAILHRRKLLAPLTTTPHNDGPPALGIHALQKTVATSTLTALRLVCFLRHTGNCKLHW